eukprot:scaffold220_cov169-Amphora_coffeaeformis.AAC.29
MAASGLTSHFVVEPGQTHRPRMPSSPTYLPVELSYQYYLLLARLARRVGVIEPLLISLRLAI